MKVALLFFGQPRFIQNKYPAASHKSFIMDKYDTDVFCHVWWSEDQDNYEFSSWAKINHCPVSKNSIDIINNIYSPKKMLFEPSRTFALSPEDERYLKANFRGIDWTHWGQKKNISNVLSQLKTIENAIELFEQNVTISDYDFVVLSRFDNHIIEFPDLNSIEKGKFFVSDHHNNFPDLLYVFSPVFCSVFKTHDRISHLLRSKTVWEPSAENFKYASYKDIFSEDDIIKIKMMAHPVRDGHSKGGE